MKELFSLNKNRNHNQHETWLMGLNIRLFRNFYNSNENFLLNIFQHTIKAVYTFFA